MANVVFEHSSAGYRELMKSQAMRATLMGYAEEIKRGAEDAISPDKGEPLYEEPYSTFEFEARDRAAVRVQTHNPHADYAERKHGHLQNAAGV